MTSGRGPTQADEKTVFHEASGVDGERHEQHGAEAGAPAPAEPTTFDPSPAEHAPRGWAPTGTVFEPAAGVSQPPPQPERPGMPQAELLGALSHVGYGTSNPLVAAAAPALMLLGELQLVAAERDMAVLARHLAETVRGFERAAAEAGVAENDARVGRYLLCETIDDIVGGLPGIEREVWLRDGMLARFFRADEAGRGFFQALNAVLADPGSRGDLLELAHLCLALGYAGQYRVRREGGAMLGQVRRDVYEALRYFRPRPDAGISPQWRGLSETMLPKGRKVPLWAFAGLATGLLAGIFFLARISVTADGDRLESALLSLNPAGSVTIRHAALAPQAAKTVKAAAPQPPPPSPPVRGAGEIDRIRRGLADDISAGVLKVSAKGDFIVIAVDNVALFESGKAQAKSGFSATAGRIGFALDREPGPIRIVGYTDNLKPGRSSVFKSNYDLSVARAEAVAKLIRPKLADPARVAVEGKGAEDPIDTNATEAGRARNRRVEVMIRREETL